MSIVFGERFRTTILQANNYLFWECTRNGSNKLHPLEQINKESNIAFPRSKERSSGRRWIHYNSFSTICLSILKCFHCLNLYYENVAYWARNFVSTVTHCFNMFHKKIINISYISMRCNAILVIYIRKWIIINFLRIYEN